MNVVTAKLKEAGLHTAFQERVEAYQAPGMELAMVVPSTRREETYAWLGDVPQLKESLDEFAPEGLLEHDYTLKNKRFRAAIQVYEDDLSDELYGQTKLRVEDMAQKGKEFPSILLSQVRANGETNLCYDGQPFHSSTHVSGNSGTQSNIVTGTGTSVAQLRTDLITGRARLFGFKTDKGDVIVRRPSLYAVVGPALEIAMLEAAMLATVSTGGQNVLHGLIAGVLVDQNLTGNSWYLEDAAPLVKPYIVQNREDLSLANTGIESDSYVIHDKTTWRVKWRGNVGYGLWQHSVKIKN